MWKICFQHAQAEGANRSGNNFQHLLSPTQIPCEMLWLINNNVVSMCLCMCVVRTPINTEISLTPQGRLSVCQWVIILCISNKLDLHSLFTFLINEVKGYVYLGHFELFRWQGLCQSWIVLCVRTVTADDWLRLRDTFTIVGVEWQLWKPGQRSD